jgi:hypothetical protein
VVSLRDLITSSAHGQLDPIFAAPERYEGEWVIRASRVGAAHLVSSQVETAVLTACGRRLTAGVPGNTLTAWDGCRRCVAHATLKMAP